MLDLPGGGTDNVLHRISHYVSEHMCNLNWHKDQPDVSPMKVMLCLQ